LLIDEVERELGWSAVIKLCDYLHSLVKQRDLLLLDLHEDLYTGRGIHEFKTIHFVKKSLDCVLLFQLVEADNGCFPRLIVSLKFLFIRCDNLLVVLIKLLMLNLVLLGISHLVVNQ
jgi:hypothetical protein